MALCVCVLPCQWPGGRAAFFPQGLSLAGADKLLHMVAKARGDKPWHAGALSLLVVATVTVVGAWPGSLWKGPPEGVSPGGAAPLGAFTI